MYREERQKAVSARRLARALLQRGKMHYGIYDDARASGA